MYCCIAAGQDAGTMLVILLTDLSEFLRLQEVSRESAHLCNIVPKAASNYCRWLRPLVRGDLTAKPRANAAVSATIFADIWALCHLTNVSSRAAGLPSQACMSANDAILPTAGQRTRTKPAKALLLCSLESNCTRLRFYRRVQKNTDLKEQKSLPHVGPNFATKVPLILSHADQRGHVVRHARVAHRSSLKNCVQVSRCPPFFNEDLYATLAWLTVCPLWSAREAISWSGFRRLCGADYGKIPNSRVAWCCCHTVGFRCDYSRVPKGLPVHC